MSGMALFCKKHSHCRVVLNGAKQTGFKLNFGFTTFNILSLSPLSLFMWCFNRFCQITHPTHLEPSFSSLVTFSNEYNYALSDWDCK